MLGVCSRSSSSGRRIVRMLVCASACVCVGGGGVGGGGEHVRGILYNVMLYILYFVVLCIHCLDLVKRVVLPPPPPPTHPLFFSFFFFFLFCGVVPHNRKDRCYYYSLITC